MAAFHPADTIDQHRDSPYTSLSIWRSKFDAGFWGRPAVHATNGDPWIISEEMLQGLLAGWTPCELQRRRTKKTALKNSHYVGHSTENAVPKMVPGKGRKLGEASRCFGDESQCALFNLRRVAPLDYYIPRKASSFVRSRLTSYFRFFSI